MKTLLKGGTVYRDHRFVAADILTEDGVIRQIGSNLEADGAEVFDVSGYRIVPGFLDIHTHGAVGVDVNAAKPEDFEKVCRFQASQGTTGWLGSVLTDTREQLSLIHIYNLPGGM